MKNGATVAQFEREFAAYVGAKHCVMAANGTVTLQAALHALGVGPGKRVAVPPLTHAATTIAVLNVGALPYFVDVHPETWLMWGCGCDDPADVTTSLPVSLYGLAAPRQAYHGAPVDAAQTLQKYEGQAFLSYSFQASKVLPLGEGGALVTDSEEFAESARSYLSLGYRMNGQARIDPAALKSPTFERHHRLQSINGRMNDLTAEEGLRLLGPLGAGVTYVEALLSGRRKAAGWYADAIAGCSWLTPQHVPAGWGHDYWTYAVACDTPERARILADEVVANGGERPYPAWRLTYHEPAFKHLARGMAAESPLCPVAESLQPRLLQFQTNRLDSVATNATALQRAIAEMT